MDTNNDAATDKSMQGVTSAIEAKLYGKAAEPENNAEEEEVSEDIPEEELPEDDDSESEEEDEGSEDLDTEDEEVDEEEASLAAYLGVDEDRIKVGEDGSIALEAIIDGEKKNVPLKELVSSYQLQGHVNNKSVALENERKEFAETRNQVYAELKQRLDGLQSLNDLAQKSLVEEYNSLDWDRIRAENPSEWSALRQEYAEKAQQIQQAIALQQEEAKRLNEEQGKEMQQQMQAYLYEQTQKVLADNPTWADESVRKAEVGKMKSFLLDTYGFQEQDLGVVQDARAIKLIQDAMKFRSGKKGVETKLKKNVPKFRKPGAGRASAANLEKARNVKAKKASLKKTGKISDAANLLLDRM